MDNIIEDCIIDLTTSYGKFGGNKLLNVINEKEERLGRHLNRDEILREYRTVDDELFPLLLTRKGK